jgi:hypothetical protein
MPAPMATQSIMKMQARQTQAKGNATRLEANLQHSRYEGVVSEKLVSCILAGSHTQRH